MRIWITYKEIYYGNNKWYKIISCFNSESEAIKEVEMSKEKIFYGELIKDDDKRFV